MTCKLWGCILNRHIFFRYFYLLFACFAKLQSWPCTLLFLSTSTHIIFVTAHFVNIFAATPTFMTYSAAEHLRNEDKTDLAQFTPGQLDWVFSVREQFQRRALMFKEKAGDAYNTIHVGLTLIITLTILREKLLHKLSEHVHTSADRAAGLCSSNWIVETHCKYPKTFWRPPVDIVHEHVVAQGYNTKIRRVWKKTITAKTIKSSNWWK